MDYELSDQTKFMLSYPEEYQLLDCWIGKTIGLLDIGWKTQTIGLSDVEFIKKRIEPLLHSPTGPSNGNSWGKITNNRLPYKKIL